MELELLFSEVSVYQGLVLGQVFWVLEVRHLARKLGCPLVVVVRILDDYVAVGVDLRQCEASLFRLGLTDSWQGFVSGRLCL